MKTEPNEPITHMTADQYQWCKFTGLTKREYFAAMAMQGELARRTGQYSPYSGLAENCVKIADALIEELNKRGSE